MRHNQDSTTGIIGLIIGLLAFIIAVVAMCSRSNACERAGGHMVDVGVLSATTGVCVKDGKVIEP